MTDLQRRLGVTIAALEGMRGRIVGAAGEQVDALARTLEGAMRELDAVDEIECCTLGCGRMAEPRRLHCRHHGGLSVHVIPVIDRVGK